ncbi:Hypothetical predicted protein [Lecanosticta acicola]|uniref:F-box domain-containing protein n=1 Tax=Lecanosticta acicola TaxID=111012 RepID=A0AAI8Z510_9PEZI|nr:Hypothetical predicted protein [Lecanosticta acicola]
MVRLLNLDQVGEREAGPAAYQACRHASPSATLAGSDRRPNPNMNQFSAALSIYPIVSVLARYLDLTSLFELSRTCHQVRANLLHHRQLLMSRALRCENESADPAKRLGNALHASHQVWTAYGQNGVNVGRITGGKLGACAMDMVGECRSCSKIICRSLHEIAARQANDHHPNRGRRREVHEATPGAATSAATLKTNSNVRAGLGEGNEGVECGRTRDCLAARMVEKDVECDFAELAALHAETAKAEVQGRHWNGSSYSTQEIVGIGGKVKTKVKKRMPVGAIVKEYEDEREQEKFLSREQGGANRSWCSWCSRVVVGKKDLSGATKSTDSIASASSTASI